jgi:hypothetical protein
VEVSTSKVARRLASNTIRGMLVLGVTGLWPNLIMARAVVPSVNVGIHDVIETKISPIGLRLGETFVVNSPDDNRNNVALEKALLILNRNEVGALKMATCKTVCAFWGQICDSMYLRSGGCLFVGSFHSFESAFNRSNQISLTGYWLLGRPPSCVVRRNEYILRRTLSDILVKDINSIQIPLFVGVHDKACGSIDDNVWSVLQLERTIGMFQSIRGCFGRIFSGVSGSDCVPNDNGGRYKVSGGRAKGPSGNSSRIIFIRSCVIFIGLVMVYFGDAAIGRLLRLGSGDVDRAADADVSGSRLMLAWIVMVIGGLMVVVQFF